MIGAAGQWKPAATPLHCCELTAPVVSEVLVNVFFSGLMLHSKDVEKDCFQGKIQWNKKVSKQEVIIADLLTPRILKELWELASIQRWNLQMKETVLLRQ